LRIYRRYVLPDSTATSTVHQLCVLQAEPGYPSSVFAVVQRSS
jgi:hypothetical protein